MAKHHFDVEEECECDTVEPARKQPKTPKSKKMTKMKKRVYVTKSDIRDGWTGGECHCPVARAIKRAFPMTYVRVGGKTSTVGKKRGIKLPPQVTEWIRHFDAQAFEARDSNTSVKPFRFTLEF